jgi:hypothetical protein
MKERKPQQPPERVLERLDEGNFPEFFAAALLVVMGFMAFCAVNSSHAEPVQTPPPQHSEYRIAIHCSLKVLQVWRKTELIRDYPIEVGMGGLGKRLNGDHRTPVGDYEVSWMASRSSSKGHRIVDKRSWCKGNSFFDGPTGPSLEKLWAEPYGGDEATVISINYPNEKDKTRGFTGECIHIHADKRHENGILKKSYGCIHMYPADAKELYELVQVGTPVKILP